MDNVLELFNVIIAVALLFASFFEAGRILEGELAGIRRRYVPVTGITAWAILVFMHALRGELPPSWLPFVLMGITCAGVTYLLPKPVLVGNPPAWAKGLMVSVFISIPISIWGLVYVGSFH